jgi:hypothetical protein
VPGAKRIAPLAVTEVAINLVAVLLCSTGMETRILGGETECQKRSWHAGIVSFAMEQMSKTAAIQSYGIR